MVHKIAPICALCALMSLLTACGASDRPTAPSSAPAATTGIVQGILRHETVYGTHGGVLPEGPLSGAQVLVTEGPGAGQSVTTGADGVYRFELPAGPFRVRWSGSGFETRDSDLGTVVAGSTTTVDAVALRSLSNLPIAQWSISGIVRDGAGNPVAGVWVYANDVLTTYADATTDAAGRYRIVSTRQHADTFYVNASRGGYVSQYTAVTCGPSCAITADFRLLRRVRQWLDGPSAMKVGDVAVITIVTEFDDGSRQTSVAPPLESSNPSVVRVLPLQLPYEAAYVKAIAPGTATVRFASLPEPLLLNVRVAP